MSKTRRSRRSWATEEAAAAAAAAAKGKEAQEEEEEEKPSRSLSGSSAVFNYCWRQSTAAQQQDCMLDEKRDGQLLLSLCSMHFWTNGWMDGWMDG